MKTTCYQKATIGIFLAMSTMITMSTSQMMAATVGVTTTISIMRQAIKLAIRRNFNIITLTLTLETVSEITG